MTWTEKDAKDHEECQEQACKGLQCSTNPKVYKGVQKTIKLIRNPMEDFKRKDMKFILDPRVYIKELKLSLLISSFALI